MIYLVYATVVGLFNLRDHNTAKYANVVSWYTITTVLG